MLGVGCSGWFRGWFRDGCGLIGVVLSFFDLDDSLILWLWM